MANLKKPNKPISPQTSISQPQPANFQFTDSQPLFINQQSLCNPVEPIPGKLNIGEHNLERQVHSVLADAFRRQSLNNPHVLLALSGGLDSAVLLSLLVQVRQTLPFKLTAMHVHHGISANADAWAQFCASACEQWQVPLTITRVQVEPQGFGLEAAARAARYQALASQPADFICLAHHQDDQAETILLQLARGAGVKGLAAMAQYDEKRCLLRPLLTSPRADLMAYATSNRLQWVEDESNADTHYDRNFMRHQLMPLFKQRYPAITQTLARSARHLAEATSLCDDLAEIDAKQAIENNHLHQALDLQKIKHLSHTRQTNLLRWWLAQHDLAMPGTAHMQQILQQLLLAAADAALAIKISENIGLRRYRQRAYLVKAKPVFAALDVQWQGEHELILLDQSRLRFTRNYGAGVALKWLEAQALTIKYRQGGESLQPEKNRPGRSLKVLFNNAGVPPWLRQSWPLLYLNNRLVLIPNIATDVALNAAKDELGLQVDWVDADGCLLWLHES